MNMQDYKKEIETYLNQHNISLIDICKVKTTYKKKTFSSRTITPIGNKIVGVSLMSSKSSIRVLVLKENSKHGVVAYGIDLRYNSNTDYIHRLIINTFGCSEEHNRIKYYVDRDQKFKLHLPKGLIFKKGMLPDYICKVVSVEEKCLGWEPWYPVDKGGELYEANLAVFSSR